MQQDYLTASYMEDDQNIIRRMSAGIRQSADDGFNNSIYHGHGAWLC